MTRSLLFISIAMIPLGRILNKPLFEAGGKVVPLTPNDLALGLLAVSYVLLCFSRGRWPFIHAKHSFVILLFPGWAAISLLANMSRYGLSLSDLAVSALYLVRWLEYACLYFIVYDLIRGEREVRKVGRWLFAGAIAFCLFGLVQSAFLPDFALLVFPDASPFIDYDPQRHRLVSTILDPNIAAGFILIAALMAISFLVEGFRAWLGPALIFVAALILTLSRGGLLGFLLGFLVLVLQGKNIRKRAILVGLATMVLGLALYPFLQEQIAIAQRFRLDDPSALSRLEDWKLAYDMVMDNKLFGIGFNTFGFVSPHYGIVREGGSAFGLAGDFFLLFVLTGGIGAIIYFRMLYRMLRSMNQLKDVSHSKWDQALARGVQSATIGVLASSLFTSLLFYPQIMALLWILWALVACRLRRFEMLKVHALGGLCRVKHSLGAA